MLKTKNSKRPIVQLTIVASLIACCLMLLCSVNYAHALENNDAQDTTINCTVDKHDANGSSVTFKLENKENLYIEGHPVWPTTLEIGDMDQLDKMLKNNGLTRDDIKKIEVRKINTIAYEAIKDFYNCQTLQIFECSSTMTHLEYNAIFNMQSLFKLEITDAVFDDKECVSSCPELRVIDLIYNSKNDYIKYGTAASLNQGIITSSHNSYIPGTHVYAYCNVKTKNGTNIRVFQAEKIAKAYQEIWRQIIPR